MQFGRNRASSWLRAWQPVGVHALESLRSEQVVTMSRCRTRFSGDRCGGINCAAGSTASEATMERHGEAFEEGVQLTVMGRKLLPGDRAPHFELDIMPPGGGMPVPVSLADTHGRVRVLNVINSLDTPVCHIETRRWQTMSADLGADVDIMTISMDLPFAQARWGGAEGVTHALLSSHRNEDFGNDYGVLLREWRLLQRAVFVIDAAGVVVHSEYVGDQMLEPNYDAAVAGVAKARAG